MRFFRPSLHHILEYGTRHLILTVHTNAKVVYLFLNLIFMWGKWPRASDDEHFHYLKRGDFRQKIPVSQPDVTMLLEYL